MLIAPTNFRLRKLAAPVGVDDAAGHVHASGCAHRDSVLQCRDGESGLHPVAEGVADAPVGVESLTATHKSPGPDRGVAGFMGDLIKQALGIVDPSLVAGPTEIGPEDPPPSASEAT